MESKFKILINLTHSPETSGDYIDSAIIHQREFVEILRLIDESMRKISRTEDRAKNHLKNATKEIRLHDTIWVSGGRGTGKTSLILTLAKYIQDGKLPAFVEKDYSQIPLKSLELNNLHALPLFDPTLINEKEHVFVNIIAKIKNEVERYWKCRIASEECEKDHDECGKKSDETEYKCWKAILKKLSGGLVALDGVGPDMLSGSNWEDKDYVAEEGLRRVHAANVLEDDFHKFVKKSAEVMNKKAFILMFDDIDTNFKKGWQVTETIRQYLTTPRLIVIATGDLALYSLLIQNNIWGLYSSNICNNRYLKNEYDRFKSLLLETEEQYLLKNFRSERRIMLEDLYEKISNKSYPIGLNFGNGKNDSDSNNSLTLHLRKILYEFGVLNYNDRIKTLELLLRLPLRSIIQLLLAMKVKSDYEKALLSVFGATLVNGEVDRSISFSSPTQKVILALEFLLRNGILSDAYTLRPISKNRKENLILLVFGLLLSNNTRTHPGVIFSYSLRIAFAREIRTLFTTDETSQKEFLVKTMDEFCEHVGLKTERSLRHIARMISGYLVGIKIQSVQTTAKTQRAKSFVGSYLGVLPLHQLNNKSKDKKNRRLGLNLAIKEGRNKNPEELNRLLVNLSLMNVIDLKGRQIPVCSFLNLLGVLGEIVESLDQIKTSADEDIEMQYRQTTRSILLRNSQIRDYPLPKWARSVDEDDQQSGDSNDTDSGIGNSENKNDDLNSSVFFAQLVEQFVKWYENWDGERGIATSDMGKAITRFFYILLDLDSKFDKEHEKSIGEWMHAYIRSFLHSVFIEEYLGNSEIISNKKESKDAKFKSGLILDIKNPIESDLLFEQNVARFEKKYENFYKLPFTKWIFSCPIWIYYLSPKSELSEFLLKYSPTLIGHDQSISKDDNEWTEELVGQVNNVKLVTYLRAKQLLSEEEYKNLTDSSDKNPLLVNFLSSISVFNILNSVVVKRSTKSEKGPAILKKRWTSKQVALYIQERAREEYRQLSDFKGSEIRNILSEIYPEATERFFNKVIVELEMLRMKI